MSKVHVFIINYNSSDLLRDCLGSLIDEGVDAIHVMDNFFSWSEREAVLEVCAAFPKAVATTSDVNLGFGPALNLLIGGASLQADDIIWMVNPDTEMSEGVVSSLVSFMDQGYDIVSPNILTGKKGEPRIWFAGGVLDRRQVRTHHVGLGTPWDSTNTATHDERETTFITGAAMMMRYSTWSHIGGFREGFFLYWEDADLSERAMALGYRLGVASSVFIWHAVGGSGGTKGMSSAFYYYMQRNRLWFGRQWMSRRAILFGSGFRETLALTVRPLKERTGRISKTASSIKGLVHGSIKIPL